MRILIIEDIPSHAQLLEEMVRPLASEVVIAYTMEQARKIIAESNEPPEIITVDLGLPDSDREDTIEIELAKIRANAPDSLVIVISGLLTDEDEKHISKHADAAWHKSEVVTSRSFYSKLRELVLAVLSKKNKPATNLRLLETVAKSITNEGKYMPCTRNPILTNAR